MGSSNPQVRIKRQQKRGEVMIWAGIIGNDLLGPFLIKKGVKINSQSYCALLKNSIKFGVFKIIQMAKDIEPIYQMAVVLYVHKKLYGTIVSKKTKFFSLYEKNE